LRVRDRAQREGRHQGCGGSPCAMAQGIEGEWKFLHSRETL